MATELATGVATEVTTEVATEAATEHAHPRAPDTVDARPLLIAALALGLLVVGSVVLLRWVLGSVERGDVREHGPAVRAEAIATFPAPALQVDPAGEIAAYRREKRAELESYRWIDRKTGTVAIPIERAMELSAQRLSARPVERASP